MAEALLALGGNVGDARATLDRAIAMLCQAGELRLKAREVVNVHDGEGITVTCLDGPVWITQASDTRDIVIHEGESYVLDRPGLALVSAPVGPARVTLYATPDCVWAASANASRQLGPLAFA